MIKKFNSFVNENIDKTSSDARGNVVRIGDEVRALADVLYSMGQIESDKIEKGEVVVVDNIHTNGDFFLTTHADRYGPYDKNYFILDSDKEPLSEDEMDELGLSDQEDYLTGDTSMYLEGYNLYTLKSRVDIMADLYVKVSDKGDEIFKVTSIDVDDIHDGTLNVVSQESGEDMIINHDEIESTLVGDQYEGHDKEETEESEPYNKEKARLDAMRAMGRYGNPLSGKRRRFENFDSFNESVTVENILNGEGSEYVILTKHNGEYKVFGEYDKLREIQTHINETLSKAEGKYGN